MNYILRIRFNSRLNLNIQLTKSQNEEVLKALSNCAIFYTQVKYYLHWEYIPINTRAVWRTAMASSQSLMMGKNNARVYWKKILLEKRSTKELSRINLAYGNTVFTVESEKTPTVLVLDTIKGNQYI